MQFLFVESVYVFFLKTARPKKPNILQLEDNIPRQQY